MHAVQPAELRSWLRLLTTARVGRTTARSLLQLCGSASAIFEAPASTLAAHANRHQIQQLQTEPDGLDELLSQTLHWLDADPARRAVVTLGDMRYPEALLTTPDPPLLLFLQGRIDTLPAAWNQCAQTGVAVVGSRNPTAQGVENARQFAHALANQGCCIVSGMALGVDGAAHEGALHAAESRPNPGLLPTIAVVGTGLDRVYPRAHLSLAHRIAQHGLLVSEFPLGTPPLSSHFPLRNRIIAGLARATLVVEATLRSGSLITAQQCLDQGKDVLAIPGSIHAPQSRGCHALIKQGAKLVESAHDVLEELGYPDSPSPALATLSSIDDTASCANSHPLLAVLGFEPCSLDQLVQRSGLSPAEVQAQLTELELDNALARLPGGLYQRTVHQAPPTA